MNVWTVKNQFVIREGFADSLLASKTSCYTNDSIAHNPIMTKSGALIEQNKLCHRKGFERISRAIYNLCIS